MQVKNIYICKDIIGIISNIHNGHNHYVSFAKCIKELKELKKFYDEIFNKKEYKIMGVCYYTEELSHLKKIISFNYFFKHFILI